MNKTSRIIKILAISLSIASIIYFLSYQHSEGRWYLYIIANVLLIVDSMLSIASTIKENLSLRKVMTLVAYLVFVFLLMTLMYFTLFLGSMILNILQ